MLPQEYLQLLKASETTYAIEKLGITIIVAKF